MTRARRNLIRCYLTGAFLCAVVMVAAPLMAEPAGTRYLVNPDVGTSCPRPCRFPQLETTGP